MDTTHLTHPRRDGMNPSPTGSSPPPGTRRGLRAIFGSTFLELVGVFMLSPLLLFTLKADGHPTWLAGLFAACGWLGIFGVTPWVSAMAHRLGRRRALWLAAAAPPVATVGFLITDHLAVWFVLEFLAGMAGGMRWVLAEAVVAECSPPAQRGRMVGLFETMVGATFVTGPALLAWVGPGESRAMWIVLGLTLTGLLWSLRIPPLPPSLDPDDANPSRGLSGLWSAWRAHPAVMGVGLVGGFFESGVSSLLPLYGLALDMPPPTAALLVSASGLGSTVLMLPAGVLADHMAHHPQQRWGTVGDARRRLMRAFAWVTLGTTALIPLAATQPVLAWPLVFLWGGAGGTLYTLAMIDIGDRATGLALVNSTAVLVMAYTLGGVLAPSLGAWALDVSATVAFPALMLGAALLGVAVLHRRHVKPG